MTLNDYYFAINIGRNSTLLEESGHFPWFLK